MMLADCVMLVLFFAVALVPFHWRFRPVRESPI
jgi:hypothetical protein